MIRLRDRQCAGEVMSSYGAGSLRAALGQASAFCKAPRDNLDLDYGVNKDELRLMIN